MAVHVITRYPTAVSQTTPGGNYTLAWTNPDNIKSENGQYASVTMDGMHTSKPLHIGGFDFSGIPDDAVIAGLSMEAKVAVGGPGAPPDLCYEPADLVWSRQSFYPYIVSGPYPTLDMAPEVRSYSG
jgi:hypothetical protein